MPQARFTDVAITRRGLAPVITQARQALTPVMQCLRHGAAQFGQVELGLGRPKQRLDLDLTCLGLFYGGPGDVVRLLHTGQLAG